MTTRCMRCHRELRNNPPSRLGPTCARLVLGLLTKKRAANGKADQRQLELLETTAA